MLTCEPESNKHLVSEPSNSTFASHHLPTNRDNTSRVSYLQGGIARGV